MTDGQSDPPRHRCVLCEREIANDEAFDEAFIVVPQQQLIHKSCYDEAVKKSEDQ